MIVFNEPTPKHNLIPITEKINLKLLVWNESWNKRRKSIELPRKEGSWIEEKILADSIVALKCRSKNTD